MKYSWILIFLIFCKEGISQTDSARFPIIISVFNNATLLPGKGTLGFINTPVHPGFRAGTFIIYRQTHISDIYESFNIGTYYHHLSQLGFQLYTELGYRYNFSFGLSLDAQALLGYLLAKPDIQVFQLDGNGNYNKKSGWRSQVMAGAGAGFSYKLMKNTFHPVRIFLNYQFFLQMPYVKNYVPMLPNTSFHVGTIFSINKKKV